MTPHSSTLARKIPWMEEPGDLQSMGSLRVGHDWATSLSLFLSCIGEGNGNPLQCSCLENPRTGEPGGLPSMGSHRVGHDWSDLAAAAAAARRSNQSILKEISPEYSLEGWMLKLKLQYFGHLMRRTDSLEKTLMLGRLKAGGEGDDRGWDGWMAS